MSSVSFGFVKCLLPLIWSVEPWRDRMFFFVLRPKHSLGRKRSEDFVTDELNRDYFYRSASIISYEETGVHSPTTLSNHGEQPLSGRQEK